MEDKAKEIFGNEIPKKDLKYAKKIQKKYREQFGDDSNEDYKVTIMDNSHIGNIFGVKNILIGDLEKNDHYNAKIQATYEFQPKRGIILGNVYMGTKSFKIGLAMASAARTMGLTPYWMDLNSYNQTVATKIIGAENEVYALGQKLSQKSFFGRKIWEPMNNEGLRRLSSNVVSQKKAELMAPVFRNIPKDIPFIGTHVWASQAAVHAGMKYVVNAIPDSMSMAAHLSEGSIHTVQTHEGYMEYRTLYGMAPKKILNPMAKQSLIYTGHYVDHELVSNIEDDCSARIARRKDKQPMRFLLVLGNSQRQKAICLEVIEYLLPLLEKRKAVLLVNTGENRGFWKYILEEFPQMKKITMEHMEHWKDTRSFAFDVLKLSEDLNSVHAFWQRNIFENVYCTNLLMRSCDVMITPPNEYAYYPVPKLFVCGEDDSQRNNAQHSGALGDGTIECRDEDQTLQMLEMILNDSSLFEDMCRNIVTNKSVGVYNGAYRAVELAIKLRQ